MEGQWNPMTPSKFIPTKRAQQTSSPNCFGSLDSNEGSQIDGQRGGDLHTLVSTTEELAQMNYRRLLAINNPEIMKVMNSVHFMATQFGDGGSQKMNGESSHRNPLTVNGKISLSSDQENGICQFLPLLEPKPQGKMAIPLLPKPNSFPQNATETASPSTPATMEKNQRERIQDDSRCETNNLVGETSNEPLQQCFSNQVDSSQNATAQHQEVENNVVFNSSEEISVQQCHGKNQDIDLNKTPQQKPRRKKHIPKVIHEGKPARTPKRATAQPVTPGDAKTTENPSGKRKYVRKKKDGDQQENPSRTTQGPKVAEPNSRSRNKLVRRSLNIELEDCQALDRLSETQGREAAVSSSIKSAGQSREVIESSTGCGVGFDLNVPANQSSNENARIPQTPNRPPHHTNQYANENVKTPQTPNQPLQLSRLEIMKRKWQDDFAKMVFNMTPYHQSERGESSKKLHKEINCQNIQVDHEVNEIDPEGTKRNCNLVDNCQVQTKARVSSSCSPIIYKKIRSENEQKVFSSNASSTSIHTPNGWRTIHTTPNNTGEAFTFADAQRFMDAEKRKSSSRTLMVNRVVRVSNDVRVQPSRINHCTVAEGDKDSTPTKMDYNQPPTSEKPHEYSNHEEDEIYGAKARVEALIAKQMKSKNRRRRKKVQDPLVTFRATNAKMELVIDYIDRKLKNLNINGTEEMFTDEPQNALIPYIGGGGAMVQFEGAFNLFKKIRKPRAKVELDSESNRVWKLLMGKECEVGGGTDMDKEKWWEEERQIFRGRVDSFIARMHLIQGDRTFSRWKGSVVDSVIGVFLTQNVSDHLSSSAFMCLAARFPPQSKVNNNTTNVETIRSPIISETEFCDQGISGMDESCQMEDKEMTNNGNSLSSSTGVGDVKYMRKSSFNFCKPDLQIGQGSPNSVFGEDERSSEDATSSQNSVASSQNFVASSQNTVQCSPMNFEGDNLVNRGRGNGFSSFTELLHLANNRAFNDMNVTGNGRNLCEEYGGEIDWSTLLGIEKSSPVSNESNQSYITPSAFESSSTNINEQLITNMAHCADSFCPVSLNADQLVTSSCIGMMPIQSEVHYCCQRETHSDKNGLGKRLDQQESNAAEFQKGRTQKEIDTKAQTCAQNDSQMEGLKEESNLRKEGYSSTKANVETLNNGSRGKKLKAEADKMKTYDWDSLRKQASESGIRKERSHGTLDSLDYEAVRNADVSEIAHTIRERGMNNLLAERIKDFLNRLVRDHGSIDLEWLRDVPPDKAKDYLLSIWGLGLKSVECVRLLTLHHLAFPVDTNVGRICVRLGWVPLQPLPESLQLHLLEMYPVLETIQKYLWPRLCKLDQRTLYELHYQLITFGKVFCTKSKPNCNACPMRGECKHFASAFASARLALPGPEEKRIVSSETPLSSEQCPGQVPNPMLLPQLESSTLPQEHAVPRNCEPIVEEPASPEPESMEASVIDIEDAFYNDPDEIPTIKLNFKEFTQNLHIYMQENNLGLQDGDMSKALVAITPEAASIPVPKLKNVNRLRTEHQVYELPDSHPLLKEMDKREPDDPCPYLLAIWTPGETAQSTEAPKSCCNSQDLGKLCDDTTCFSCNSIREAQAQTVRGTILIPCRTANRGSFPLNGTYFQVNEVFADHDSSRNPIDVPRGWIWSLARRTVYFGTSIPSIFKGLTTEGIQYCFWRGFVCVRGFDRMTRAPKPLFARLHFPASKVTRNKKTPSAPPTPPPPPPPRQEK